MVDNSLSPLIQSFEENTDSIDAMVEQMINKLQFIVKMHGEVTNNVGQTQIRQKQAYASQKGKHMFFIF
jgi:uncharacterized protein YecE (DUF72 family)